MKHIEPRRKRPRGLPFALAALLLPAFGGAHPTRPKPTFPASEAPLKTGYLPSPAADVRKAWGVVRARGVDVAIPEHFDLRDGNSFLPPIGTQEKSDCVAWSTAYYAFTYSVAQQQKLPPEARATAKYVFSPQYLYPHINGGKDGGSYISRAMEWLAEHGCATFAEAPYDDKDFTTPPSPEAEERAGRYKARKTVCLASVFKKTDFDPQTVKEYMVATHLPVVTGIRLYKDFPGFEKSAGRTVSADYVYDVGIPTTPENLVGGHAMAIVGYDNAKKAFLFVNSWGSNWGADGFIWISEEYLKQTTGETWGFVPGGMVSRGLKIPISADLMAVAPTGGK